MGSVGLRPVEVVVLDAERAAQAQLVVHQPHRLVERDVLHIVIEEIATEGKKEADEFQQALFGA